MLLSWQVLLILRTVNIQNKLAWIFQWVAAAIYTLFNFTNNFYKIIIALFLLSSKVISNDTENSLYVCAGRNGCM